jgi:hypothetical protein
MKVMQKVAVLAEPWVEKMDELMVVVTVASKEKHSVDEMESWKAHLRAGPTE